VEKQSIKVKCVEYQADFDKYFPNFLCHGDTLRDLKKLKDPASDLQLPFQEQFRIGYEIQSKKSFQNNNKNTWNTCNLLHHIFP
jgi:hypothetical protein